jgi:hypothetical protein
MGATDATLEIVGTLPELKSLSMDAVRITDDGLKHVGKLTQLTRLRIPGTPISDEGLKHLEGLTKLEHLLLKNVKNVTAGGVAALQKALPNCTIEWDGPM